MSSQENHFLKTILRRHIHTSKAEFSMVLFLGVSLGRNPGVFTQLIKDDIEQGLRQTPTGIVSPTTIDAVVFQQYTNLSSQCFSEALQVRDNFRSLGVDCVYSKISAIRCRSK